MDPVPLHALDVLAQEEPPPEEEQQILRDVESPDLSELTDPNTILELITDAFAELGGDIVARLPLMIIALIVFLLLLVFVRLFLSVVTRTMVRGAVHFTVRRLVANLLKMALLLGVILLSLSIAGVEIGAMLAALGLIGLGIALALQNILENLLSGVLILIRKPYDRGENIILTDGIEGFVEDIDLRVTTVLTYDGTLVLIPNADIFRAPITNLSRRGNRRTTIHVGIDYRDDHERARELLFHTVDELIEVMADPPPQVLLTGLGDSSVDFEVRVWFDVEVGVPKMQDLCYRACKTALDEAGFTIPWPIRTLAADMQPLQVEQRQLSVEQRRLPVEQSRLPVEQSRLEPEQSRLEPEPSLERRSGPEQEPTPAPGP